MSNIISTTYIMIVTIFGTIDKLPNHLSDECKRTLASISLDDIEKCEFAVIKHKMQSVFAPEHLNEVDEVWMFELAQHAHLAHSDLSDTRISVVFRVSLDCNNLTGAPILAFEHDALQQESVWFYTHYEKDDCLQSILT